MFHLCISLNRNALFRKLVGVIAVREMGVRFSRDIINYAFLQKNNEAIITMGSLLEQQTP